MHGERWDANRRRNSNFVCYSLHNLLAFLESEIAPFASNYVGFDAELPN